MAVRSLEEKLVNIRATAQKVPEGSGANDLDDISAMLAGAAADISRIEARLAEPAGASVPSASGAVRSNITAQLAQLEADMAGAGDGAVAARKEEAMHEVARCDLPPRDRDLPPRDVDLPSGDADLPPRDVDLPPQVARASAQRGDGFLR